jgi:hypothetical protein
MSTEDFLKTDKSRIINEILQTETNYVADLQKMLQVYGDGIQQSKHINDKEFKFIFSAKGLVPVNEILLERLQGFWSKIKIIFKMNIKLMKE